MKKRIPAALLCASMLIGLLAGCGTAPADTPAPAESPDAVQAVPTPEATETGFLPPATEEVEEVNIVEEAVALLDMPPAVANVLRARRGDIVKSNERAEIDYSNTESGYVILLVKDQSDIRWKAQVKGPTTTYTYNLTPGTDAVLPLSDGNGSYQVTIYENVTGTKYAAVISQSFTAALRDEFIPFRYSNQYVNYDAAPYTAKKAAELCMGKPATLDKVAAVYDYVVSSLTYDRELAATVKSGYLPDLDAVLEKGKGICFDYAALMAGMLRSQGVPCKLVVGYAGSAYHAWISVWTEEHGWIDNVIYFNGSTWQRMDPTFASSGGKDPAIMAYIGDGSNYSAKYFY